MQSKTRICAGSDFSHPAVRLLKVDFCFSIALRRVQKVCWVFPHLESWELRRDVAEALESFGVGDLDAESLLAELRDMGIDVDCTAEQLTLLARCRPTPACSHVCSPCCKMHVLWCPVRQIS